MMNVVPVADHLKSMRAGDRPSVDGGGHVKATIHGRPPPPPVPRRAFPDPISQDQSNSSGHSY